MKNLLFVALILTSIQGLSQTQIKDFEDAKIYFAGLFGTEEQNYIDEYGNVIINMGSASAGRVQLRLSDVKITKEEKPEEPGCADICPPRVIIHFACKKSGCIKDPMTPKLEPVQTGTITIFNTERGRKAYDFLISFQEFAGK